MIFELLNLNWDLYFMDFPAFYHTEIKEGELQLSENEAHHAIKVLRLNKGDTINLMDGLGNVGWASIDSIVKKSVLVQCEKVTHYDRATKEVHLAIAPTKKWDRMAFLIEKLTEIGVTEITPILCQNSEQRFWKDQKAQNAAIAAMKQSRNPYLPKINALTKFSEFISTTPGNSFLAHCKETPKSSLFDQTDNNSGSCCIIIGPEGDFTSEEIALAENSGVKSVTLGSMRLRTETAGLVSVIKMIDI